MEFHAIGLNSDDQQVRNIAPFFANLHHNPQFDIKPIGIEEVCQRTHSAKSTFWNFVSLEFDTMMLGFSALLWGFLYI